MGRAYSVTTLPILSVYQPEANSQEGAKENYLSPLWFIPWILAFIKKKSKLTLCCLFYTFVLCQWKLLFLPGSAQMLRISSLY